MILRVWPLYEPIPKLARLKAEVRQSTPVIRIAETTQPIDAGDTVRRLRPNVHVF
jgi:hypothetical protein